MSDQEIQVPRIKKDDLLRQPDFQNGLIGIGQSTSISMSESEYDNPRFAYSPNSRRNSIFRKDEISSFSPFEQTREDKKIAPSRNFLANDQSNSYSMPISQLMTPRKQSIERMRRSSFFEVQALPQTHINLPESNDLSQLSFVSNCSPQTQVQRRESNVIPLFSISQICEQDLILRDLLQKNMKNNRFSDFEQKMALGLQEDRNKTPKFEIKTQKSKQRIITKQEVIEKKEINRKNKKLGELICFYCGGNHYSNQCALKDEDFILQKSKCLNCKEQGHTARYCPQQKKCHFCGKSQHLARDCPSNEATNQQKICHNCNQKGHFAKECLVTKKCFLCHQIGHQIKNCPSNRHNRPETKNSKFLKPIVCFNCQKSGHYANQCTEPQKCHKCFKQGHYSRDCPYMFRSLSAAYQDSKSQIIGESIEKFHSQPEENKKKITFLKINFKKRGSSKNAGINSKSKRKNESKKSKANKQSK